MLLSDEPSLKDALGGAHERVADAVVKLLRSAIGGKSIRIDGEWGAGKSTVVNLLCEKLERSPCPHAKQGEFAVFLYDAWVHSGDPLKRAFFTALLDKFEQTTWLKKQTKDDRVSRQETRDYWNEQLDVLSSRIKRSEKKEAPTFTHGGRTALALLATFGATVPYLLKLLGYMAEFVGQVCVALSVIVIVFLAVRHSPEPLLNYILLRSSDTKRTETRGDYTPTSLDFQDVFGRLMGAMLDEKDRRLVIVIDNLDRVGESEIREVWGLLRSFLDNPTFAKTSWFQRLWVIIPLADASRIGFSMQENSPEKPNGDAFLEKVFQVRFKLPPPMLHSWKQFMRASLEEAFGADEHREYEDIERIYEIYLTEPIGQGQPEKQPEKQDIERVIRTRVTPRAIISFVNDLVAMRLEQVEAANLPLLAAYHLASSLSGVDDLGMPLINQRIQIALGAIRLRDRWAMVHHNAASLDEASYIVSYTFIHLALTDGNLPKLRDEIQKSPGASYVLSRFIHDDLPLLRGLPLLRAAYALKPLVMPETPEDSDLRTVVLSEELARVFRDNIRRAFSESVELNADEDLIVEALGALFEITDSSEKTALQVVERLSHEGITEPEKRGFPREFQQAAWVKNLCGIVRLSPISSLLRQNSNVKIVAKMSASDWGALVAALDGSDVEWALRSVTPSKYDPIRFDHWLASQLTSEHSEKSTLKALQFFVRDSLDNLHDIAEIIVGSGSRASIDQDSENPVSAKGAISGISHLLNIRHDGMRDLLGNWMNDSDVGVFIETAKKSGMHSELAKWSILALWVCEGLHSRAWTPARTSMFRQYGADRKGEISSDPQWFELVRSFFQTAGWSEILLEADVIPFIFRARLFDLFNYEGLIDMSRDNILIPIAQSKVLRTHLKTNNIDVEDFSLKYINDEWNRRSFVEAFRANE